jgi:hypothetical protein
LHALALVVRQQGDAALWRAIDTLTLLVAQFVKTAGQRDAAGRGRMVDSRHGSARLATGGFASR